ncbi:MAG: hypothetical protein JKY65_33920, partial [Planctomycetes bacterium]|nr:hypothetical protein [Planctomycetota bacterium]
GGVRTSRRGPEIGLLLLALAIVAALIFLTPLLTQGQEAYAGPPQARPATAHPPQGRGAR